MHLPFAGTPGPHRATAALALSAAVGLLALNACSAARPSEGDAFRRTAPSQPDALARPAATDALLASRTALVDRPSSTAIATEPGVREILIATRTITPDGDRFVHKLICRPRGGDGGNAGGGGGGSGAADGPSAPESWVADTGTLQTLHLRTTPDGGLTLLSTTESADSVTTDFEPPLLVLPATMAVGQTATQTLKMIVRPIADPSRIRTQGDATQTITYEGDERLTVPAGEFNTRRVRSVLSATLGQARVVATTITWYADDIGQIAEFREEVVTVLGVRIRHNARTWADLGKNPPPPPPPK